jgi:hypothetical protein
VRACIGLLLRLSLALGIPALLLAPGLPARAQSIEGVLMPGPVITGHAKTEMACAKCHTPFDKAAQDKLCLDCHKPVGEDIAQQRGMHGRINKRDACRTCHTDHKGRDAKVAAFDTETFKHAQTDFALRDAHLKVKCESCHLPAKKYRDAPGACNDCHRKDDKHKGTLGPKCADCHTEANWKEARFDHDKTRFKLLDKHLKATCASCHKESNYEKTPVTCIGCHRKDDKHKGHLGEKCEACHGAADWKVSTFDHDRDTKFALHQRHRTAKCESCHTGIPQGAKLDKLDGACLSCHRKEDKHNGTLGPKCENCHNEKSWKEAKFDHSKTKFALTGGHANRECKACHKDQASFKDTPLACLACHKKDDTHKARYGEKCEACHADTKWTHIRFSHDRDTKYPLRGVHLKTKCDSCHTGHLYNDKAATTCIGCHRKDDKHKGQLAEQCERCHVEDSWKRIVGFDHGKSRFPLVGRHIVVECKACHLSLLYKDAKSDCLSCHQKDDKHKRSLGVKCETCHNARDWKSWDFDHARKARYPLDGAHKPLACAACHIPGIHTDPKVSTQCVSCHSHEDVHEGQFGRQCERCHVTTRFNVIKSGITRGKSP